MTWRAFVPGRIEVFGKHTDYAGGHSLVAAVPMGITVSAQRAHDRAIRVLAEASGEKAHFPLIKQYDPPRPFPPGWRRYPAAVIARLFKNFARLRDVDLSCAIAFSSSLPQAAGMSSSSALVIACAEAIIACADLEETADWKEHIRTPEDRAAYFGCIESGARYGPLDDGDGVLRYGRDEVTAGVGTHGGSEDHAAILLSRPGHLGLFGFSPLRTERYVSMPHGWCFVVASSGVEAEKAGSAREAYNRLADPAAMTGARLDHFLAEDARVLEAADAFAAADISRVAELAAASQRDADRLLGNQVPETRDLVALALDGGAAAASSFGAGWGGSVWALVRDEDAAPFADRWHAAYRARHPQPASAVFLCPPSSGLYNLPQ